MKSLHWYLILATLMIISLSAFPGCVKVNPGGKVVLPVSDVTLAAAVDSESKPVNATNTFTVATEAIYISLKLNEAPANTQVMARLTYLSGEATSLANSTTFLRG